MSLKDRDKNEDLVIAALALAKVVWWLLSGVGASEFLVAADRPQLEDFLGKLNIELQPSGLMMTEG